MKRGYQEPWFWFVMSPLIVVVFVSSFTVYVSVKNSDDRVKDDYYKEGRLINAHRLKDKLAASLGLSATVKLNKATSIIELSIAPFADVDVLAIDFSHPADEALDRRVAFEPKGQGRYEAALSSPISGRWYIEIVGINDEDLPWRLKSEWTINNQDPLLLTP